ncbi:hypothetical protein Goarm_011774 [Gossypium armourianum]|uniref:Uncharacterized protein n=1 Tax=Gossypium armourianum TaxID=34283 RepID=A0A7J9IYK9_9ROSI|nr:hypothetical protein [Gossypium armourianum]
MSDPTLSSKDLLLGKTNNSSVGTGGGCGKDFEFMEGDFTRTTVNEMPATNFSNQAFSDTCTKRRLEKIGRMIGKVVKLDFNTDNMLNGRLLGWQSSST